ncbi:PepSY domain-containing protein [Mesorhizobium microcysteis]|uniref:PepSY domain-containing protein n=1 Tax=Neoaquamicrobium microcysteis TaxID=2682781 RepID=A0A5D4H4D2_9HYPH|nr:PepSY domain-containing protein [Mesorhizobium microcysteis]TYR34305.1 PepSY domain-containing protein [Mesorhizobium microcysteis]
MTDITGGAEAPQAAAAANKFYFIAWRWHFYAGLYVIPFLVMLATTGLVMLWISWGAGIGGERTAVAPQAEFAAVSALQTAAESAVSGGQAVQYIEPLAADRAAVFAVASDAGRTGVVVDPYTAEVLQTFAWRAGWYDFANKIHGTLLLGSFGDRMIEIAASLAIVMVVTGLYLHWPRNGATWRETLLPRLTARGRTFWKSLHGVLGFWISAVLVVFLISGLSWAGIWGERMVQAWNTFPAEKWGAPLSDVTHASMNHDGAHEVPWGLEQTPLPASGSLAGTDAIEGDVTIDSVAQFARGLGFVGRFQINIPGDETGVWTVSHDSMSNDGPNPAADRTIHIDQYSGNVLADVRYADYSPYAKAMAWGIAFHEGDLGVWNLVFNTLFCLSVIGVSVSGLVMWWKRRPAGAARLAAPPRPRDLPLWKGAAALVVVLGIAFPLAGAAIVAVLLLDATLLRVVPRLRHALS